MTKLSFVIASLLASLLVKSLLVSLLRLKENQMTETNQKTQNVKVRLQKEVKSFYTILQDNTTTSLTFAKEELKEFIESAGRFLRTVMPGLTTGLHHTFGISQLMEAKAFSRLEAERIIRHALQIIAPFYHIFRLKLFNRWKDLIQSVFEQYTKISLLAKEEPSLSTLFAEVNGKLELQLDAKCDPTTSFQIVWSKLDWYHFVDSWKMYLIAGEDEKNYFPGNNSSKEEPFRFYSIDTKAIMNYILNVLCTKLAFLSIDQSKLSENYHSLEESVISKVEEKVHTLQSLLQECKPPLSNF